MWLHKPVTTYAGLRLVLRHRLAGQIDRATAPVSKTPAAGRPSPAGATGPPREAKRPAAGKRSMDPARRAKVLELIRADLAAGVKLSKRTVPGRYGVSAYHGEQLLAEARGIRPASRSAA